MAADIATSNDARAVFAEAASKLLDGVRRVTGRVPTIMPDFEPRLSTIVGEIPLAADELVSAAQLYANNVASGGEPLRRDPPPEPEPEPAVQVESILQNLTWHEGAQTFTRPRYAAGAMA